MNSDQIMIPKMATGFREDRGQTGEWVHPDSVGTGRER